MNSDYPKEKDLLTKTETTENPIDRLNTEAEAKKEAKIHEKKRLKPWLVIGISTLAATIGIVVLYTGVFQPMIRYNFALKQLEKGNYKNAYSLFCKADGYKDSEDYLACFSTQYEKKVITTVDGTHTIEFEYDDHGKLLSQKNDGEIIKTGEYVYDDAGNLLKETIYDEAGNLSYECVYKRSSDGNLIETSYTEDRESFEISKYNEKGKILSKTKNGTISEEYFYYENGSLAEDRHYYWNGSSDAVVCVTKYNEDGKKILYTENGKVISETAYNEYGDVIREEYDVDSYGHESTYEYKYKSGKPVKSTKTTIYKGGETFVTTEKYKYDSSGKIVKNVGICRNSDGNGSVWRVSENRSTELFKYDDGFRIDISGKKLHFYLTLRLNETEEGPFSFPIGVKVEFDRYKSGLRTGEVGMCFGNYDPFSEDETLKISTVKYSGFAVTYHPEQMPTKDEN